MKKLLKVLLTIIIVAVIILCVVHFGDKLSRSDPSQSENITVSPGIGDLSDTPDLSVSNNDDALPAVDLSSWELILVNKGHPVSPDRVIPTVATKYGYLFDARAVSALNNFIDAGKAEGLKLALTSAYRSYEYQKNLFDSKVRKVMAETGKTRAESEEIAAQEVAKPGTSEHSIGLAVDIVCDYYGVLDAGYADTAEAKWLLANCAQYGFILRYPTEKQDITGVIYEPWHFRYVGKAAAEYIMSHDICLEEFLELEAK